MAADPQGNDIAAVQIPRGGRIAVIPRGLLTAVPTPDDLLDPGFTLPDGFLDIGLLSSDGGPQWSEDPGTTVTLWDHDYPVQITPPVVRLSFTTSEQGQTADLLKSDFDAVYAVFSEERFHSGSIRRRIATHATVESFTADRAQRGTVLGDSFTLRAWDDAEVGGKPYLTVWVGG